MGAYYSAPVSAPSQAQAQAQAPTLWIEGTATDRGHHREEVVRVEYTAGQYRVRAIGGGGDLVSVRTPKADVAALLVEPHLHDDDQAQQQQVPLSYDPLYTPPPRRRVRCNFVADSVVLSVDAAALSSLLETMQHVQIAE